MQPDYRIKNGHVIDSLDGVSDIRDVIISGRTFGNVHMETEDAVETVDASGYYVIPGLIDFHTHVYSAGSTLGIAPDVFLATGVTTVVDAGTTGCCDYEAFHRTAVDGSMCRVFAQACISSGGQFQLGYPEDYNPKYFDKEHLRELTEKYRGELIGIKIRFSKETMPDNPLQVLDKTLDIAEEIGLPVIIHTTDPPVAPKDFIHLLRKGDVYCHCYQGMGHTILNEKNEVCKEVWDARERGVIFDAANGTMNFNFRVAKAALAAGFAPDVISTDTATRAFGKTKFSKNLPYVMSKFLTLGMSMEDIVKCTTAKPAELVGMKGRIGTLRTGTVADLTILKRIKKNVTYYDRENFVTGKEMLVPVMTFCGGRIVYCSNDFWC